MFGLTLILSAIFSFVTIYSSSLDRKIEYSKTIIPLKAKEQRTKAEEETLAMNEKLIEVTKSNENFGGFAIALVLVLGISLSAYGAKNWHEKIQKRDDKMANLQIEKIEAEIANIKSDGVAKAAIVDLADGGKKEA